jgi:hypothetical protein
MHPNEDHQRMVPPVTFDDGRAGRDVSSCSPTFRSSTLNHPALQWPVTTLDFEASSLARDSFPIEIGVARWDGPGSIATTWSVLMEPMAEWMERCSWSRESERIHGISIDMLDDGLAPAAVMALLNERCPIGTLAFCDGGRYDAHWLSELATAADVEPRLHLGSWHRLIRCFDEDAAARIRNHRAPNEIVHRAGPDAMDHIRALAAGLGVPEPSFRDLDV